VTLELVRAFLHEQSYERDIGALPYEPAHRQPPPGQRERAVVKLGGPAREVLRRALGPLRWEPSNAYNPHRAYPSARAVFCTEAYLIADGRALHYDPNADTLVEVDGAGEAPAGTWVALAAHPGAVATYYGNLRYALALLEAGHLAHTLAAAARALGADPVLCVHHDDRATLALLGLPADGSWSPAALIGLAPLRAEPPAASRDAPVARGRAPEHGDFALERATWIAGRTGELPVHATAPGSPEVLYARTSGRAGAGLSARAAPVPRATVDAVLALLPACPIPDVPLRLLLAVERVEGLQTGLHEARADGLELRRAGRILPEVQAAFGYPPWQVNITSLHVVWFLVARPDAVLDRHGPRGARLLQLALGWTAQGIALASAAAGLLARPVRAYDERRLDDLLELATDEVVGYEILGGAERFTDLAFDLRP
jgi:hypothetical protein